jgi:hypothetical protein
LLVDFLHCCLIRYGRDSSAGSIKAMNWRQCDLSAPDSEDLRIVWLPFPRHNPLPFMQTTLCRISAFYCRQLQT